MSTTVGSLLDIMARHLQETDRTMNSGLWTQAELVTFLSEAQQDFLSSTGVVKNVGFVPSVTSQVEYDEPSTSMDMERVSWNGKKMYPTTQFELDQQDAKWRTRTGRNPRWLHRDNLGIKRFAVSPAPNISGTGYTASSLYGLVRGISGGTYTYTGFAYAGPIRNITGARNYIPGAIPTSRGFSAAGTIRQMIGNATNFLVIFDVLPPTLVSVNDVLVAPDAFCRYVMYGALFRAWGKEGDGQDLRRSQYCRSRFEQGVKLAQRLVEGNNQK